MSWLVTNLSRDTLLSDKDEQMLFYYASERPFSEVRKDNGNVNILIDGYVLPRRDCFDQFSHLEQYPLIEKLFLNFGTAFIDYIKGAFNILIIDSDRFYIFNDRHSIKKFFIYRNENQFLISNSLKTITDNCAVSINRENIALFCLMEHFIDGMTLYDDVSYSKPASKVTFDGNLDIDNYWQCDTLLTLGTVSYPFDYIAKKWRDIINSYVLFLKPKDITMTLTGGNDSRMILSALLNLGIDINTFTFGNPKSNDGVIAEKIAEELKINYNNHYVRNPTPEWFNEQAKLITQFGNSLINIHRAHRLSAVKDEIKKNPDVEMIFGGFMGGDYIKGIIYDDYITAKLLRLYESSSENIKKIVIKTLKEKSVNIDNIDLDKIVKTIQNQPFIYKNKKIEREFSYVANVIGAVHDTQDITVFGSQVKYTVNPYMDIDFLKILFSTKYSMMNNNNSSKNQLKRFMQPRLQCEVLNRLAPELSDIRFAKKGSYSVNDFLGNKLIYLAKRAYRYKLYKSNYPPNFPYGSWIKKFCEEQLRNLEPIISDIFKINDLEKKLSSNNHPSDEGYWHLYTNIINLDMITKYYKR